MKIIENKNLPFMILSLIVATIIWFIIADIINPLVHETITVPLDIRIDEELIDTGRSFSVPNQFQRVSISYYIRQNDVGSITVSDLSAYIDVDNEESGFSTVNIVANEKKHYMHNINCYPQMIYVTADDMAHKNFKVTYRTTGRLANDNLTIAYVTLEPNEIFIEGPATEVEKISSVSANIDISGKDSNFAGISNVVAYDIDGNALTNNLVINSSSVNYIVTVYNSKNVTLNATTTGNVASSYSFAGLTINPSSINISATNEALSRISTIYIPAIDITDLDENKEYEFLVSDLLPAGVRNNSDVSTIKITVMVNELKRDRDRNMSTEVGPMFRDTSNISPENMSRDNLSPDNMSSVEEQ